MTKYMDAGAIFPGSESVLHHLIAIWVWALESLLVNGYDNSTYPTGVTGSNF